MDGTKGRIGPDQKQSQEDCDDPFKKAIYEAMLEELGVGRMDALPLQDSGRNANSKALPIQAKEQNELSARWSNLSLTDNTLGADGLDNLADGSLARQRKQDELSKHAQQGTLRVRELAQARGSRRVCRGQGFGRGQASGPGQGSGRERRGNLTLNTKMQTRPGPELAKVSIYAHRRTTNEGKVNLSTNVSTCSVRKTEVRPLPALASPGAFLAHAGFASFPARLSSNACGDKSISSTKSVVSESVVAQPTLGATIQTFATRNHDETQKFWGKPGNSLLTARDALDQRNPARGLNDSMWATPVAVVQLAPAPLTKASIGVSCSPPAMSVALEKQNVRVSMKQVSNMPFGRPRPGKVHLVVSGSKTASVHIIQEDQLRVHEKLADGALLYIDQGNLLIYKPATSKAYWRMEFGVSQLASAFRSNCMRFLEPDPEGVVSTNPARQATGNASNMIATTLEADDLVAKDLKIDARIRSTSGDDTLISLLDDEEDAIDKEQAIYCSPLSPETLEDLQGISKFVNPASAARVFQAIDQDYMGGFAGRLDEMTREQWIKDADLDPVQAKRVLGAGLAASMWDPVNVLGGELTYADTLGQSAGEKITEEYLRRAPTFNLFNKAEQREIARNIFHQAPERYRQVPQVRQPLASIQAHASRSAQGVIKYTADELKDVRQNAVLFPETLLSDEDLKIKRPLRKNDKGLSSHTTQEIVSSLSSVGSATTDDLVVPQHHVDVVLKELQVFEEADSVERLALKTKEAAAISTTANQEVKPTIPKTCPLLKATDNSKLSEVLPAMASTNYESHVRHRISSSETSTSTQDHRGHSVPSSITVKPAHICSIDESKGFRYDGPMSSDFRQLSKSFGNLTIISDSESPVKVVKSKDPTADTNKAVRVAQAPSGYDLELDMSVLDIDNRNLKGILGLESSMWAPSNIAAKSSRSFEPFPGRTKISSGGPGKSCTQYGQHESISGIPTRPALSPSKKENVKPAQQARFNTSVKRQ